MNFAKAQFSVFFKDNEITYFFCPFCSEAHLSFNNKLLKTIETQDSIYHRNYVDLSNDYMSIEENFHGSLICQKCENSTMVAGTAGFDPGMIETAMGPEQGFLHYFKANYFFPPIHFFSLHEEIPNNIKEVILKSFELAFIDPSAAINSIRSALELLCTHYKVKQLVKPRGKPLTLHKRIELLEIKWKDKLITITREKEKKRYERNLTLITSLFAAKWLGNTGSHALNFTHNDLYDGYKLLEHILNGLFSNHAEDIDALANSINKNKGAVS